MEKDKIVKKIGKKMKLKKKTKLKKKIKIKKSCEKIILDYEAKNTSVSKSDINSTEYQDVLKCMSNKDREELKQNTGEFQYLYPNKDDEHFNIKLTSKKEFYDTRYLKKTPEDFKNIKEIAQKFCENTEFELQPHQMFVRNFVSSLTPYNSLLLYHGLGTGKTCSAISVCEEMRSYNSQMGDMRRIIIVASPKVQENFKIQLFDERKLKNINGLWNIKACTGNKFIKEINPMNMKGLNRIRVIRQIKKIIRQFYHFQGYGQFSNYIKHSMNKKIVEGDSKKIKEKKQKKALKKEFSNRMVVIDEIHNMRFNEEGSTKPKESSENLIKLFSYSDNIKLLILSATPMFNSYLEIVWLLNILNINDNRFPISEKEIFNKMGSFVIDKNGVEKGKNLLIQKATGYISYVRGENPFTFPNSVWPSTALNPDSLQIKMLDGIWKYPEKQINGGSTLPYITLFDLVLTKIGDYQNTGYDFIIRSLKKQYPAMNDPRKGIAYTILSDPLQALNMIYPNKNIASLDINDETERKRLFGKVGLSRVMLFDPKKKRNFGYKDSTLQHFGRIFSFDEIGKYSSKIKYILNSIKKSKGIVFIYSQYIDGGAVPVALALEELGITRYGSNNLFETEPSPPLDAKTMKPIAEGDGSKNRARYIMITGDKNLTPDTADQIKAITGENNANGEIVKVVIVTRAGSEGLDFKNIREMHILDPWYNYNRQKQIIGRAIRNLSHCALPYEERNCSIFLYGTEMEDPEVESADLYIYRLAEKKALKMAKITRILKETAVDCLLNNEALNFSQKNIQTVVEQKLSNGNIINFNIGDKEHSDMCDFTTCAYKCKPDNTINDIINDDTYNESFISMNLDKIIQRIRLLFKEQYFFKKNSLIAKVRHLKNYPLDQIYSALTYLINENNEYITDILGRLGHLVNIGEYYLFQPIEIESKFISRFERVHPIDYKRKNIEFTLPERIPGFIGTIEEKKDLFDSNIDNMIKYLHQEYNILNNPTYIDAEYKNNWTMRCAWAIKNLVFYNTPMGKEVKEVKERKREREKRKKAFKKLLVSYAMEHILDSYSFIEKTQILSYITKKENKNVVDTVIDDYFEKFKIENETYQGIVLAQFDKPESYQQYTILSLEKNNWVSSRAATASLARDMFSKFQIIDIEKINDVIGFMINFGSQEIVFKIKDLEGSTKGRSNKGKRCANGESKNMIIQRINKLLPQKEVELKGKKTSYEKYNIAKEHKSSIQTIYGKPKTKQNISVKKIIKEIKINSQQLCAENELIFRHYNAIKKDGKIWFFDVLRSVINNIEKLKK